MIGLLDGIRIVLHITMIHMSCSNMRMLSSLGLIFLGWPKVLSWKSRLHSKQATRRKPGKGQNYYADMKSQNRSHALYGHLTRQAQEVVDCRALATLRCSRMSLHSAWLLAFCLLLATLVVMTTMQWRSLRTGTPRALQSRSWADPWMEGWVAEQELLQASDPVPGTLLCSGLQQVRIAVLAFDTIAALLT